MLALLGAHNILHVSRIRVKITPTLLRRKQERMTSAPQTHTHIHLARNYICSHIYQYFIIRLRGGADKSLARPTFRCCRTESTVPLERAVCSCAELQVFFVTEAKRSMSNDARDFNNMETRAAIKFFLQGKAPKENHAILTETLGNMPPSKTAWPSSNVPFMR